jgi:PPK2 family polyphosphate:nucleotide phosphotransferase
MAIDLRLKQGGRLALKDADAGKTFRLTKESAEAKQVALQSELAELQDLLFAAGKHALLVVLQGMDTSGKDGTLKHVMDPVNPGGVIVHPFKVPTERELAHDFLWRIHRAAPGKGMIAIFNRSHYEDVLVVRVHDLVPRTAWRKRYRHIRDFERLLTDSGTIVLKFFLHISRAEQEERLLAREQEVEKAWKLSPGDWKERELWDEYQHAYEDAITETSTKYAPWYIVPADKKWARNHLVTTAIVEALRPYRKEWLATLEEMGREAKEELEAFRQGQTAHAGDRS